MFGCEFRVACVYCAFIYGSLRSEGAYCECASSVWCDMLVTAFARFGCCALPPSPKCRERAASTLQAACACVFVCMGVRFDAIGADEYLVVVRVVWHAVY